MSKGSNVLKALCILGPEEILKLSEVVHQKHQALKKAAGEDLVVWGEDSKEVRAKKSVGAKILPFPESILKSAEPEDNIRAEKSNSSGADTEVDTTELLLKQREINRTLEDSTHKLEAANGYKQSTSSYLVHTVSVDGVKEHRHARTTGVLIDKKIA